MTLCAASPRYVLAPTQCKARLGAIVHKKTATALALTSVKNEVRTHVWGLSAPGPGHQLPAAWVPSTGTHQLAAFAMAQRAAGGLGRGAAVGAGY